ncbi:MAG: CHAD domain-containing protein [Phycisphaerae bacterium]|nr:CHAD domain-containing protein [Phycisphaerae bacterium]
MAGRWLKGLGGAVSVADAARLAADARLTDVAKAARALDKAGPASRRVRAVHSLRVATRRADAALRAFEPLWAPDGFARARKALRKLRRAAAAARDADVQADLIGARASGLGGAALKAARVLLRRVRAVRKRESRALDKAIHGRALPRLERAVEALRPRALDPAPTPRELARSVLAARASDAAALADADLSALPALHALRIALKRLRYAIEVFAELLDPEVRRVTYPALERLQARLGRLNDAAVLLDLARTTPGAAALTPILEREIERGRTAALRAVRAPGFRAALTPSPPGEGRGGVGPASGDATPTPIGPVTLAAIDAGSNAVRMRVERWDGGRRILADERRTTRLGRGLASTRRLDAESVEATAGVLAAFADRARELGATRIAAVATAAVREAENGAALVALARTRAGLDLRVIDGDEEARLGLRAAGASLDLGPGQRLALVDVGGGSVEVVISIDGVIVRLVSMPLGAVRLTEAFGGPEASSTTRFDELLAHVESRLDAALGAGPIRAALRPDAVVGVGGTFTTLGFVKRRGVARAPAPGLERVTLGSLSGLLERVRRTPIGERAARFPGIPPDRADIIAAGLAVIRAVLARLSARACFVQEGGVREGMILAMARGETPGAPPTARGTGAAVLEGVRAFAARASCEQPHSAHVAALALRLFDRLRRVERFGAALSTPRDSRLLLECAAHLHDAGILVEYAAHHKHSQAMILHARLPGLEGERRLVVAAVARYHRRSGPPDSPRPGHEAYLALPPHRRAQVSALSAVLRVADGLDRAHAQAFRDVRIAHAADSLTVRGVVAPGAAAAAVAAGLATARKKGDLFESVFGVRLTVESVPP